MVYCCAIRVIDHSSYDESPQLVKSEGKKDLPETELLQLVPVNGAISRRTQIMLHFLKAHIPKAMTCEITKVLTVRSRFLHLYSTKPAGGEETYFIIMGRIANNNIAMASNSAPNVAGALLEVDSAAFSENLFEGRTRACDSDRHPSNDAAERLIQQMRRPEYPWNLLTWKCTGHKVFQTLTALGALSGPYGT